MKKQYEYPDEIKEIVEEVMIVMHKEFIPDSGEVDPNILKDLLSKALLERHDKGEPLKYKENELIEIMERSITESVFKTAFEDTGFIDTIENEEGTEIVFLTPKGIRVEKESRKKNNKSKSKKKRK